MGHLLVFLHCIFIIVTQGLGSPNLGCPLGHLGQAMTTCPIPGVMNGFRCCIGKNRGWKGLCRCCWLGCQKRFARKQRGKPFCCALLKVRASEQQISWCHLWYWVIDRWAAPWGRILIRTWPIEQMRFSTSVVAQQVHRLKWVWDVGLVSLNNNNKLFYLFIN